MKLLFVCGRNRWRSPTAERIFANRPSLEVRARGLSSSANRRLIGDDVSWADAIFVMESSHKRKLVALFRTELGDRPVHILDIPDDYQFMDPELIELLETGVRSVIGRVDVV